MQIRFSNPMIKNISDQKNNKTLRTQEESKNISFGDAFLKIITIADTHNNKNIDLLLTKIKMHIGEIFKGAGNDNVVPVVAVLGDWFMNPAQKRLTTYPGKDAGYVQAKFLKRFLGDIRKMVAALNGGSNVKNLKFIVVPGNHGLGNGVRNHVKTMEWVNPDIIGLATNVEPDSKIFEWSKQYKQHHSINIPDNETGKSHKVNLFGLVTPGMKFYIVDENNLHGMKIPDLTNKKINKIKKEDVAYTLDKLSKIINEFEGEAIGLCHSAPLEYMTIWDDLQKKEIHFFSGHEHEDDTKIINHENGVTSHIHSLGKNAKSFDFAEYHFSNNGLIVNHGKHFVKGTPREENCLTKLDKIAYREDNKLTYRIEPHPDDPNPVRVLTADGIRENDNDQAKMATDAIFEEIKKIVPKLDLFMLPSSCMRNPFKVGEGISRRDFIDIFGGQEDDLSNVYIGKVKGKDLVLGIVQYMTDHLVIKEGEEAKNTLIHCSGLQQNKTAIREKIDELLSDNNMGFKTTDYEEYGAFVNALKSDKEKKFDPEKLAKMKAFLENPDNFLDCVKVKNKTTGKYEDIDTEKKYIAAVLDYLLKRPKIPLFNTEFHNWFTSLNKNINDLILESPVKKMPAPDDIRIL